MSRLVWCKFCHTLVSAPISDHAALMHPEKVCPCSIDELRERARRSRAAETLARSATRVR